MSNDQALLRTVIAEFENGRLVAVPGQPGKVYWPISEGAGEKKHYVGVKITTERRARSWLSIAAAGRQTARALSASASQAMQHQGLQGASVPFSADSETPVRAAANPSHSFNPASRRQRSQNMAKGKGKGGMVSAAKPKSTKAAAWRKKFGLIGRRASVIQVQRGCSWGDAWRQAKAEVEAGAGGAARANPWYNDNLYLPDETEVRQALVPSWQEDWSDSTMIESALVPGPYTRSNPRNSRGFGHHSQYEQFEGQFGVMEDEFDGFVPVNRRNPAESGAAEAMRLYHSGQAASLKEAWAMVKRGASGSRSKPQGSTTSASKPTSAKAAAWRKLFGLIGARASVIQAQRGCSWGDAWRQAKAEVESEAKTTMRSNPWYRGSF
jgi:hypothetical protein